jgi:hypothetical protein
VQLLLLSAFGAVHGSFRTRAGVGKDCVVDPMKMHHRRRHVAEKINNIQQEHCVWQDGCVARGIQKKHCALLDVTVHIHVAL